MKILVILSCVFASTLAQLTQRLDPIPGFLPYSPGAILPQPLRLQGPPLVPPQFGVPQRSISAGTFTYSASSSPGILDPVNTLTYRQVPSQPFVPLRLFNTRIFPEGDPAGAPVSQQQPPQQQSPQEDAGIVANKPQSAGPTSGQMEPV